MEKRNTNVIPFSINRIVKHRNKAVHLFIPQGQRFCAVSVDRHFAFRCSIHTPMYKELQELRPPATTRHTVESKYDQISAA